MIYSDHRGYLKIIHETDDLVIKQSFSKKNVFRGLHHQSSPYEQIKFIKVLKGQIIDFQLNPYQDVNELRYFHLKPEYDWVIVPGNLAHGFLALEETIFEYICIGKYSELDEKCYNIEASIRKKFKFENLILSNKDKMGEEIKIDIFTKIKK